MACGCCIVGVMAPVNEVINDGVEDKVDTRSLSFSTQSYSLLENPKMRVQMGNAARRAAIPWDQSHTLPRLVSLIESSPESDRY